MLLKCRQSQVVRYAARGPACARLGAVGLLHGQDLVADALPHVALPAAANSHERQA
jgi:ABC-type Mn2+/Zn2+ transport system permease subunit